MMKKLIVCIILLFLFMFTAVYANEQSGKYLDMEKITSFEGGYLYKAGKLHIVQLNGNYHLMGRQYGQLLKPQINSFYNKAVKHLALSGESIVQDAEDFAEANYKKYPARIKSMFNGMAETSGLKIKQLMIVDMYPILIDEPSPEGCSALAAWGDYTGKKPLVYGKNEDFYTYFKDFNDSLAVIVYNPDDGSSSVASICNAGEVSTLNEINSAGLVLAMNQAPDLEELAVWKNKIPPFINYLSFFFNATDSGVLDAELRSYRPLFGYIVNTADTQKAYSYECTTNKCVRRSPQKKGLLVGTNHFIAPSWVITAKFRRTEYWQDSELRMKNLLALAEKYKGKIDVGVMMKIFDISMENGGATNEETIFQFITVPAELKVWIKVPGYQGWTPVDLNKLFKK